jgi:hypothetical protein
MEQAERILIGYIFFLNAIHYTIFTIRYYRRMTLYFLHKPEPHEEFMTSEGCAQKEKTFAIKIGNIIMVLNV